MTLSQSYGYLISWLFSYFSYYSFHVSFLGYPFLHPYFKSYCSSMVYPDLLTLWSFLEWNLPFWWLQIPTTCWRHSHLCLQCSTLPQASHSCYLLFFLTQLGIPWTQGISHLCKPKCLAQKIRLKRCSLNKEYFVEFNNDGGWWLWLFISSYSLTIKRHKL